MNARGFRVNSNSTLKQNEVIFTPKFKWGSFFTPFGFGVKIIPLRFGVKIALSCFGVEITHKTTSIHWTSVLPNFFGPKQNLNILQYTLQYLGNLIKMQ